MDVSLPLADAERAELERLRAELAALRNRRGGGLRAVATVLLLTFGVVLAPVAVSAVWLDRQINNTDRYVQTVAPLADDPAIQRVITDRITAAVFDRLDVSALTDQAAAALTGQGAQVLGSTLDSLSQPIAGGVQSWAHDQIGKVVASDQFAQAWAQANRVAHAQLVAALKGENGALVVRGDTVSLRLQPFVDAVKQRLVASGFTLAARIPAVDLQFTILRSSEVERAQAYVRAVSVLGLWLPILSLALLAAGVFVAGDRRRALVVAGVGVALAMVLLGAALLVGRASYLQAIQNVLPRDAATALFDTMVRFLRTGLRMVLALGLVVAAGAYLSGPAPAAVTVRGWIGRGVGAVRSGAWRLGLRTGPAGPWIARHKRLLRVAVVVTAALMLVFWNYPDGRVVLSIAAGAALALLVIELVGGRTSPPAGRALGQ